MGMQILNRLYFVITSSIIEFPSSTNRPRELKQKTYSYGQRATANEVRAPIMIIDKMSRPK